MQNPSVKPAAIKQMAEMNEMVESQSAALEMYQYAVDQEDSDPQTWKVRLTEVGDEQYYLDYLKDHDLNEIYQKVATEALAKVGVLRYSHVVPRLTCFECSLCSLLSEEQTV